jgi:hypothetical protein
MEDFWKLYKSDREFKDHDPSKKPNNDPRFAYIKMCDDLKVYPRSSMIIRGEKTQYLDFSNKSMLNKSAQALAESLKLYPLTINRINLSNNGLKPKDCVVLIEAM